MFIIAKMILLRNKTLGNRCLSEGKTNSNECGSIGLLAREQFVQESEENSQEVPVSSAIISRIGASVFNDGRYLHSKALKAYRRPR
jgi:hypothetical protein